MYIFITNNFQEQFDSYFKSSLSSEIEELEEMVKMTDEEVVFCHNDLLVHNILFDEKEGEQDFSFNICKYKYYIKDIFQLKFLLLTMSMLIGITPSLI